MKEDICTIPVNEIFEQKGGCPICRLRERLETKYVDYITGAAMMEPDVRVTTNKIGFCERHYGDMLALQGLRLPICLMIETHLKEINDSLLQKPDKASIQKLADVENGCFVCDCVEDTFSRWLSTLYRTYRAEPEFREMFAAQEYLCLPHYRRMIAEGKKALGGSYKEFSTVALGLAKAQCEKLEAQLKGFEDAFDHRNAGKPVPVESRDAIERTVEFITSRKVK